MKNLLIITLAFLLAAANAAAQQDQDKTSGEKVRDSMTAAKSSGSTAKKGENSLIARANEYIRAVLARDAEAIYKFMSFKHTASLGGKAGTIEVIKGEFEIWRENKLNFASIKIKPESQNPKTNSSPQKIKISVIADAANETATFDGELTAATDGDKWIFIDDGTIIQSFGVKEFEPDEENVDEKETDGATKETTIQTVENKNVLNGNAVSLPKPVYPKAAAAVRASGTVEVSVVIDEKGEVVAAEAVSGHPLLRSAAVNAAQQAKFKPTTLDNQPIKVSGIIVYNFTP